MISMKSRSNILSIPCWSPLLDRPHSRKDPALPISGVTGPDCPAGRCIPLKEGCYAHAPVQLAWGGGIKCAHVQEASTRKCRKEPSPSRHVAHAGRSHFGPRWIRAAGAFRWHPSSWPLRPWGLRPRFSRFWTSTGLPCWPP